MRYLIVAATLLFGFGCNGCGSKANGPDTAPHPQRQAKPTVSEKAPSTSADASIDSPASSAAVALPEASDEPSVLVDIDKFGVRVSGGSWFKAQPASIRRKHGADFKPKVVAAFRRLSPLKATGRTVGRSLFHPAIVGLGELLDKRAALSGNRSPVPVELRVKSGVPFWLVTHFANFLLWNDSVAHLEVRSGKKTSPLVIARSAGLAADAAPSCAQGQLLLRKGRGLSFWEPGHNQGLALARNTESRPQWAGPPEQCGPWSPINPAFFDLPLPDGPTEDGLRACATWRVEAIDTETSWQETVRALARSLPEKSVVLLGNANRPKKCER